MGSDIHGWVEHKVGNKWIAVCPLKANERNYRRFALLAGVRDEYNENNIPPKGIPEDISETARYDIERHWDETFISCHSHSYMSLDEACEIFNETADERTEFPSLIFFDQVPEDVKKARLVFWFDH